MRKKMELWTGSTQSGFTIISTKANGRGNNRLSQFVCCSFKDSMDEVYAHPLEHARQDAIKRFDDAFSNRQGDTQARVLQFVKSS